MRGIKSDFEIIEYAFPREDLRIVPVGDLHIGARETDLKAWKSFAEGILSEPHTYVVILGDLLNNGLKSSVTNVYEETMRPADQKKYVAEQLEPLKDRILCGVEGNHEARSGKDADDDPLYDVFCKMDIEDRYRQNAAFLALRFGEKAGNGLKNPTYSMVCTHGSGGGALTGSAVNKNERFGYNFEGLDILCTGHTHKPVESYPSKIVIDLKNRKVKQKPFICITASAWMQYGGYSLRKQLQPASILPQVLELCGTKKQVTVNTVCGM